MRKLYCAGANSHTGASAYGVDFMSAEKLDSNTALDARGDIWRRIDEGTLDLLYLSPEGLMQPLMLERLSRQPLALVAIALVSCSHEGCRAAVDEPTAGGN